jgi:hypothetical protein
LTENFGRLPFGVPVVHVKAILKTQAAEILGSSYLHTPFFTTCFSEKQVVKKGFRESEMDLVPENHQKPSSCTTSCIIGWSDAPKNLHGFILMTF